MRCGFTANGVDAAFPTLPAWTQTAARCNASCHRPRAPPARVEHVLDRPRNNTGPTTQRKTPPLARLAAFCFLQRPNLQQLLQWFSGELQGRLRRYLASFFSTALRELPALLTARFTSEAEAPVLPDS